MLALRSWHIAVRGEWMAQAHGLRYEIKSFPIVFFDWFDEYNNRKLFDNLLDTELPTPRLLHRGNSISVDELLPELDKKTDFIKSIENPEGIVYRVERKDKVDFLAKWVRSDFNTGQYIIDKNEDELIWNI